MTQKRAVVPLQTKAVALARCVSRGMLLLTALGGCAVGSCTAGARLGRIPAGTYRGTAVVIYNNTDELQPAAAWREQWTEPNCVIVVNENGIPLEDGTPLSAGASLKPQRCFGDGRFTVQTVQARGGRVEIVFGGGVTYAASAFSEAEAPVDGRIVYEYCGPNKLRWLMTVRFHTNSIDCLQNHYSGNVTYRAEAKLTRS